MSEPTFNPYQPPSSELTPGVTPTTPRGQSAAGSYALSAEDAEAVYWVQSGSRWLTSRRLLRAFALLSATALGAALLFSDHPWALGAPFSLWLGLPLIQLYTLHITQQAVLRMSDGARHITLQLEEQGLRWSNQEGASSFLPWSTFAGRAQDEQRLFLKLNNGVLVLPRRAWPDERDWTDICARFAASPVPLIEKPSILNTLKRIFMR